MGPGVSHPTGSIPGCLTSLEPVIGCCAALGYEFLHATVVRAGLQARKRANGAIRATMLRGAKESVNDYG